MDGLQRLVELQRELQAQGERLEQRSRALEAQLASASDAERAALGIAAEVFREMVETGIEFQRELVDTMIALVEDGVMAGEEGEVDVGLEQEHADVLLPPLRSFVEMLDVVLGSGQYTGKDLADLQGKKKQAEEAITLVENLILPPEDDEGEGDDAEDEEAPESGES